MSAPLVKMEATILSSHKVKMAVLQIWEIVLNLTQLNLHTDQRKKEIIYISQYKKFSFLLKKHKTKKTKKWIFRMP